MPGFVVELTHRAQKDFRDLDNKIREKVTHAIDELEHNPAPIDKFDVTKLSGTASDYRIRIQHIRIQYTVDWKEKKVIVYSIQRKKDRTYK